MTNDEVVTSLKDFEGCSVREIKNMGPNNWTIIFNKMDENGMITSCPSMCFMTGTQVLAIRAKD